jgi:hypothetical protein
MQDMSYLVRLARRCSDFQRNATEPDVLEQLRIWSTELAEMTKRSKRPVVDHEITSSSLPKGPLTAAEYVRRAVVAGP